LNYALASRQRAELAATKENEALVEKNLATLEEDVKAAKERCEGDIKALKAKHAEEFAKLAKKHEEELANAMRDRESAIKTMNTGQGSLNAKDERIKALAKDNEAALAEVAALRQEKVKWESDKDNLEVAIGEKYEEGFKLALDQVKVLFPDIDQDTLGKADAMLVIEGGKLVPQAPVDIVQDSPDEELPANNTLGHEPPAGE
jgi:seryl-tRNA synthetase